MREREKKNHRRLGKFHEGQENFMEGKEEEKKKKKK